MDPLGEFARFADVGLGGLTPDQVGVGRIGETARNRVLDATFDVVETLIGAVLAEDEVFVALVYVAVISCAESASVRATIRLGTSITSAARRAATSFWMNSRIGTSTLPPMWPHFLAEAS